MSIYVIGGLFAGLAISGIITGTMGYMYVKKRKEEIEENNFNDSQNYLRAGLFFAFLFNFLCIILTYAINTRLSGAFSMASKALGK